MAFGAHTNAFSAQNKTANQASTTATYLSAFSSGTFVWVAIAVDNAGTVSGDEGAFTSVSDNAGNTFSKAREDSLTQGAAQAGAVCSVWYATLTNAVTTSTVLTVNFSNNTSRDASVIIGAGHSIGAGNQVSVEATGVTQNTGDPTSLDVTSTNAEHLRIRCIASETNSTTALTATTNFTAINGNQTTGGGAASNMAARAEYRVFTGTNSASDPTFVAADSSSVYVVFLEFTPVATSKPFKGVSTRFFRTGF